MSLTERGTALAAMTLLASACASHPSAAATASCPSVDEYCANLSQSNHEVKCVRDWSTAEQDVTWCTADAGSSLYDSVNLRPDCSGFDFVFTTATDTGIVYIYDHGSAALIGIAAEGNGSHCVAGDATALSLGQQCYGRQTHLCGPNGAPQVQDASSDAQPDASSDAQSCTDLDVYCGTRCVQDWATAQKPSTWCTTDGGTANNESVYIVTGCDGLDFVYLVGTDNGTYYYYSSQTGQLVGVGNAVGSPSGNFCRAGATPQFPAGLQCGDGGATALCGPNAR